MLSRWIQGSPSVIASLWPDKYPCDLAIVPFDISGNSTKQPGTGNSAYTRLVFLLCRSNYIGGTHVRCRLLAVPQKQPVSV